jgi:hypothetical protein
LRQRRDKATAAPSLREVPIVSTTTAGVPAGSAEPPVQPRRQADGAFALASLLNAYGQWLPPVVAWEIDATGTVRGLLADTGQRPAAALRTFHRLLGGTVSSYQDNGRRHVKATARHRAHRITVWTPTAR